MEDPRRSGFSESESEIDNWTWCPLCQDMTAHNLKGECLMCKRWKTSE